MTLFALPMSVLGGYGKDFVEGSATDRDIVDLIEDEYGPDIKIWMQIMIKAVNQYTAISQILHKIDEGDTVTLRTLLGGTPYDNFNVMARSQFPLSYVTPLTASAHPDSVAKMHALLGPYKSATAPAPPALLNPQPNNAQTLIDIVSATATKEDRHEVEKMKTGVARSAGLFMSGTLNEKTGKV